MKPIEYHCGEIEHLLCDYLDGTLTPADRAAFETHLAGCATCSQFVADCQGSIAFLSRCETPEPPRELLTRIIHQLPEARTRTAIPGWRSSLQRLFQPVLQPKFAMGMAMTILSFSMLGKFVGPLKPITPADLDPVRVVATVDDKIHRTWNNIVKYYESLRVVYEIQSRLREWNAEQEEQPESAGEAAPTPDPAGGK